VNDIYFGAISLGQQNIKLISDSYNIVIPVKAFEVVKNELLSNYDCITNADVIYCPCNTGISQSFPNFNLIFGNQTIQIK
jgi:hypothetical protein